MTNRPRSSTEPAPASPAACAAEVLEVVPAVMNTVRVAMRQQVGSDLSVPQFRCLNFISREPDCSVGAVASFLGVKLPTASAMVDRLVRAGAVSIAADPADRRRSRLRVTDAGRGHLSGIRRRAHADLSRTLSHCSADELQTLRAGLEVLRNKFFAAPID